jgi:hypothetical protein
MVQVDVEEHERNAARLAEGASPAASAALTEVVEAVRKIGSKRRRSLRPTTKAAITLLIAYGIFLIAAYYVARDYVPPQRPDGEIVEILHNPRHEGGFTYSERSYQLWRYADENQFEQHSPVLLYEELTPLGPARSRLEDVQRIGHGHYAFLGRPAFTYKEIFFSTSDNSDPRTNGRRYYLVLPRRH